MNRHVFHCRCLKLMAAWIQTLNNVLLQSKEIEKNRISFNEYDHLVLICWLNDMPWIRAQGNLLIFQFFKFIHYLLHDQCLVIFVVVQLEWTLFLPSVLDIYIKAQIWQKRGSNKKKAIHMAISNGTVPLPKCGLSKTVHYVWSNSTIAWDEFHMCQMDME